MFHLTIKMMQTLNGFIAKSLDDNLDWGSSADKQLYKKISIEYGTVIVGSNTYMQMPKAAFKNREMIVAIRNMSHHLNESFVKNLEVHTFQGIKYFIDNNTTFIEGEPCLIIEYLKSIGKTKALLVGGGIINNVFLKAKLVNELQITIAPKIFGNDKLNIDLQLESCEKISDNELVLTYKVLN
jgi:dihydrofolate reductase